MNVKTLDCPLEIKELGDAGEFSGYASVFGNVDLGGDVVERGAFKEYELTKDGKLRILNQHRASDPVGKAAVKEDDHGLYFEGKLLLDIPSGRTVYSLMKAGILDGMSIGYDILAGGAEVAQSGVRRLKAMKLWEASTVTFGMNSLARITAVKAANSIKTTREFEDFLRDEGGFSHQAAKRIASVGWAASDGSRDEGEPEQLKALEALRGFSIENLL